MILIPIILGKVDSYSRKLLRQAFGSQLRRNMTSGLLATGFNLLLLAVSYPVYLHFIGYQKYDIWLILTAVIGFAQLGMLGIKQALIKLVAEEYARNNIEAVQSYVAMSLLTLMVTGTAVLLTILFLKGYLIRVCKLSGENADLVSWLLPYASILTVYVFLVQALNATVSGLGRMDLSNYILVASRATMVCVAIPLLWKGGGIEALLIGNAVSYVFIHIGSLVCIRQEARVQLLRARNWDWQRFKRLFGFGAGVFGGSLIQILLDPFNKLMLSRYGEVGSITVYDIAFRSSMQVRSFGETGLRALMPEISRLGAKLTAQARTQIRSMNRRAFKLVLVLGTPLYGGLFVVAHVLLAFWLGKRFVEPLPQALRMMLVGSFVSLLGVPAFYTLMGLGKVRHCFISIGIQSSINVTIMISVAVLAPKLVSSYVFLAAALGMCGATVYLMWQLRRSRKDRADKKFII